MSVDIPAVSGQIFYKKLSSHARITPSFRITQFSYPTALKQKDRQTDTMSLPTRTLGKNGPQVTGLGLGLMSIGGMYGPKGTDEERLALLDRAHDIGEHFWDTADVYGDSEELIGRWIRKNPAKAKDIFLASKSGIVVAADGLSLDSSAEYLKAACERSLEKLGVDSIDLYYCHRVDGKTPIEKTVEAMVELKK